MQPVEETLRVLNGAGRNCRSRSNPRRTVYELPARDVQVAAQERLRRGYQHADRLTLNSRGWDGTGAVPHYGHASALPDWRATRTGTTEMPASA